MTDGISSEDAHEIVGEYREFSSAIKVPILGSYGDRKNFLTTIKQIIDSNGLVGMLLANIKDLPHDTPRIKLHSILSEAKFVIADDTEPCGEIIELEYCRNVGAITAMLRKNGKPSSWMTSDFEIHSRDFQSFSYQSEDIDSLRPVIDTIIKWAEDRRKERQREFESLKQ